MSHTRSHPFARARLEGVQVYRLDVVRAGARDGATPSVEHAVLVDLPEQADRIGVHVETTVIADQVRIGCAVAARYALPRPVADRSCPSVTAFVDDIAVPAALSLTRRIIAEVSDCMFRRAVIIPSVLHAPLPTDAPSLQDWFPACTLQRA